MYKSANFASVPKQSPSIKRSNLYSSTFGSSIPELQYAYSEGADTSKYRFGFNGMAKDFEKAKDAYDFGSRIYESRLGRWYSTDIMQMKFPNVSPYSGIGNNPIFFIDIDGNFIIPENIKQLYPNLETVIKVLYEVIENLNQEKIDEICKIGGFANKQQILDLLTPGNGPIIDVQNITNYLSADLSQVTELGKQLGINNRNGAEAVTTGTTNGPITITLDDAVAFHINSISGNAEAKLYKLQLLIHELTHFMQIRNDVDIDEVDAYKVEKIVSKNEGVVFSHFGYMYEGRTSGNPNQYRYDFLLSSSGYQFSEESLKFITSYLTNSEKKLSSSPTEAPNNHLQAKLNYSK
jgi:RHS repeat-associated protein